MVALAAVCYAASGRADDLAGPMLLPPAADTASPARQPVDQPVWAQEGFSVAMAPQEPAADESPENDAVATDQSDQPVADPPKPPTVGDPLAPGMMLLLKREIEAGLKKRGIEAKFNRFERYLGGRMNISARAYTGSELNGICRLKWYEHLLRNPLLAPGEAEAFTRQLHQAVITERDGLGKVLAIAAEKLDVEERPPYELATVDSGVEALEVVRQALTDAQVAYAAALAPLTRSEVRDLSGNLYRVFTEQADVGHTLPSRSNARRLCLLLEEKVDRSQLMAAIEALAPITDPQFLGQLASLEDDRSVDIPGVSGQVVGRINTPSGAILVGGRGANTYQLDSMADVSVVIDLGGNDTYHDGTVSLDRPVLIVIDLGGDDAYRSRKPGVQGSAILGISMLLDLSGNDTYQARDVAQASCLGGAGILIDYDGNDSYVGFRRVQGQAVAGVGILIDRAGSDRYHGALWTQGMGGPLGFGLLDDVNGKDHYYTGGVYPNSYLKEDNPTPGYEGWGQGVGGGPRAVANGGIGVILDGGDDDVYEFDYLSHGGGYWCGVGFARDFGGNDRRLGATEKAYDGGPRTQRRYQRFGTGFGCHYALGFCFDDQGNDQYYGTIMGLGFAWDCSVGALCDFGGNDQFLSNSSTTQGGGAQAGLGILFDYNGDDNYSGYGQGRASSGISYHDLPACGGNFGFVVDYGGEDKYGSGARNNSYNTRSSSGGFLIDRPKTSDDQAGESPTQIQTSY